MTAATASSSAPADVELAVRALGLGLSRFSDGRLVTNAFDADAARRLEALGFRCSPHARFPGRAEPGTFYECVRTPPAVADVVELVPEPART